ncbi:hypothetical protein TNCT1_14880 [Streptomyces sp. 1-11]|nr:hypothetical protein TNCT1_14880 [Streptomyces sp. 1-11]
MARGSAASVGSAAPLDVVVIELPAEQADTSMAAAVSRAPATRVVARDRMGVRLVRRGRRRGGQVCIKRS